MAKTAEITPTTTRGKQGGKPARGRIRVVVRRIEPWSVLKVSLLFYFCIMLIVLAGLGILYMILSAIGVLDSLAEFVGSLGFGDRSAPFQFNGFWIFSRLFLVGVIGVVAWSIVNLCVAFLYNLISDIVGGIQISLTERD